jgi:hypothetical protein
LRHREQSERRHPEAEGKTQVSQLDQEIARVALLRGPLMIYRQSKYAKQMTPEIRAKLKTYDDAITAAQTALEAADEEAQAAALVALQGIA